MDSEVVCQQCIYHLGLFLWPHPPHRTGTIPEGKHRTTINLSIVLSDALKMRGAIERRSITSILEESAAKRGWKTHRAQEAVI